MNKKIVFLSPHPDDIEFFCGGTLVKLIEEGNDISVFTFSHCEESVLEKFPKNILVDELKNAMIVAGVKTYTLFDFKVRRFNENRQDILELLVKINNDINPDIVFLPSVYDTHQDHQVIYNESLRAFKNCSLISYDSPLNSQISEYNLIINLEQRHVDKKLEIIKQYKSQSHRHYSEDDYLLSVVKCNGARIKKKYAELFKIIKLIYE